MIYDPLGLNRPELIRLAKLRVMISQFDTKLLSASGFRYPFPPLFPFPPFLSSSPSSSSFTPSSPSASPPLPLRPFLAQSSSVLLHFFPSYFRVLVGDKDIVLPTGEKVESGMTFRNEFQFHPLSKALIAPPTPTPPAPPFIFCFS